jgi:heme exporter protein A
LPAEANGLFLKMDALHNLSFWCALRGVEAEPERLRAALARWQLDHPLLSRGFPVEKFSTGMKRRLALARLGLTPSPCWLLDEPLYGLDTDAVAVFRGMLQDHLRRGGAALVVSHELGAFQGLDKTTVTLSRSAATGTTAPRSEAVS